MKIKVIRSVSLILALAMVFNFTVITTNAAQPINVFLDGRILVFEVEPQLMNGYTMVPIGQTIQYLTGKPADWNPNTKTMTFEAYGSTIVHTVGENRIFIDGVAKNYPTSSMIINNRTLVPIRMLADASKCQIDWDGNTKTIRITSPNQPYMNTTPSQPQQSSEVRLYDVRVNTSDVRVGYTCEIEIIASAGATRAWIHTPQKGDLTDTSHSSQVDSLGRKTFTINWSPETGGTQTITAYVENERGTRDSKKFDLHIAGSDRAVRIESLSASPSHAQYGANVNVRVTTNSSAELVWFEFADQTSSRNYDYYDAGNGRREFEMSFTIDGSAGTRETLYVYARDESGNEDRSSTEITVESREISPSIYQINPSNSEIAIGDSINIDVIVSGNVNSVDLDDGEGTRLNGDFYSSNGTDSKIFRISNYQPQTSGTKSLTIGAYSASSQTSRSCNIHVNSQEATKINSVDYPLKVTAGDSFTLTIHTVMGVPPTVRLSWDSGDYLNYNTGEPDVGAGQMTIPATVNVANPGTYNINILLCGANGTDQTTITVTAE